MGREPDLSPRGPEPQLSRDPPSAPLAGTGFVWHSGSAGPRELYPGCTAIAQAPATSTTLQRCGCSVHLMGEETGSEAGPMCWSKSNPGQPISQFCPREGDQGVVPAGPGQPHRATRSWLGSSQHTRPSLPPTWGAALCAPRPDIHPHALSQTHSLIHCSLQMHLRLCICCSLCLEQINPQSLSIHNSGIILISLLQRGLSLNPFIC